MKRCPTCQKTFDDAMRFCQTDGTPLVPDEAPADPYKTMVASAEDIASALKSTESASTAPPAADSGQASSEEEPLQIPSQPLQSSTPASELKTRIAQSSGRDEAEVIEIPPLAEQAPSEAPSFSEPSPAPPSFGEPPPSPFGEARNESPGGPGDFPTTPPIPSPFGGSNRPPERSPSVPDFSQPESAPYYSEPEPPATVMAEPEPPAPQFAEPEPPPSPAFNPFEAQAAAPSEPLAQTEWTPPPSPASSFQNQPGGTNMQSPPPAAGQNKTLAIVSLVCGILGVTICCGGFLPSLLGLVLGFMARSKANSDPAHYGGSGLAMGGVITGAIGLLGGLVVWVVYFLYFAAIMSQMGR